jgi:xanthine dehydrogenase accessory factor
LRWRIILNIHVLRESTLLHRTIEALERRIRCALILDPGKEEIVSGDGQELTGWKGDKFIRCYRPRPRLLLLGRSIELRQTASIAKQAGFDVDASEEWREGEIEAKSIDQDTAVALLFHDIEQEGPALRRALNSQPFYIGALGSSRTHKRRTEKLQTLGYSQDDIKRIKAPIGLFGNARDANTLALSVLADIAAAGEVSARRNIT